MGLFDRFRRTRTTTVPKSDPKLVKRVQDTQQSSLSNPTESASITLARKKIIGTVSSGGGTSGRSSGTSTTSTATSSIVSDRELERQALIAEGVEEAAAIQRQQTAEQKRPDADLHLFCAVPWNDRRSPGVCSHRRQLVDPRNRAAGSCADFHVCCHADSEWKR